MNGTFKRDHIVGTYEDMTVYNGLIDIERKWENVRLPTFSLIYSSKGPAIVF
jgi:hypothetical protein